MLQHGGICNLCIDTIFFDGVIKMASQYKSILKELGVWIVLFIRAYCYLVGVIVLIALTYVLIDKHFFSTKAEYCEKIDLIYDPILDKCVKESD